jgi:hypothetical protein
MGAKQVDNLSLGMWWETQLRKQRYLDLLLHLIICLGWCLDILANFVFSHIFLFFTYFCLIGVQAIALGGLQHQFLLAFGHQGLRNEVKLFFHSLQFIVIA